MKKVAFLFLLAIISENVFSQSFFIKQKPINEKAALTFTEAKPSVIFFGAPNNSDDFKKHKLKSKAVNSYFGGVYTNFPIFDIGKENVVEFNNSSDKFIFYRPNTKKAFGMIISNGKDNPILVTNPNEYLKTIKTYLNIGNADYLVPKTFNEGNQKNALQEIQQILKINFVATKTYAEKLIANVNSSHYPKTYGDANFKMHCNERIFEMYTDSSLTTKIAYSSKYVYNNKNQPQNITNIINGKETTFTKYVRNGDGLIMLIISGYLKNPDTTKFIYDKDKYYTINFSKGRPFSYDTYFLNDQMQCVRQLSIRSDQSIVSDINYVYDKFGRVVREGKSDSEVIYTYNKDADKLYSSFKSYSLNPRKLELNNEVIREKNKNTFVGKNGSGEQTFKSISVTNPDRSIKTYAYDKDNKLTSVSVIKCAE
ncbi:hypothetical protein EZJ43_11285 [Pedobacter changchengzhani]|uniref:RHS repeat protein n=1 Tax=Pedobacter changchengzhani TaxID=2529274 RepID=A0A4R5MK41_9SPHI|nr:hypothetical protein [Pedobacter changchengzhani]TDG35928.1 hypothetical protein EZJ43_11285 [Pedobacter changchengzhani]